MKNILKEYTELGELLGQGRWPNPDIPAHQMLWILTVTCRHFKGDYWVRHMRPDLTENFAQGIDIGITTIFQQYIGVNTKTTLLAIPNERLRLPSCLK